MDLKIFQNKKGFVINDFEMKNDTEFWQAMERTRPIEGESFFVLFSSTSFRAFLNAPRFSRQYLSSLVWYC